MSVLLMTLWLFNAPAATQSVITLDGLPLQMDWHDADGDGRLDLTALMLVSQTNGTVETYFEAGSLRGIYEDLTIKEKYLVTYLHRDGGLVAGPRIDLGQEAILGFAVLKELAGEMVLWKSRGLTRFRFEEDQWKPFKHLTTPGLLSNERVSLSKFAFWRSSHRGPVWVVPDLGGIHLISGDDRFEPQFIHFPTQANTTNRSDDYRHTMSFTLPSNHPVDGDAFDELVFSLNKQSIAYHLDQDHPFAQVRHPWGVLVDLNGDGFVDLVQADEEGEIDRMKDLPKVKSRVKTYIATGPFQFPEEPQVDQLVPGFVISENDSDIKLAEPFLDLNQDGRRDIAGIAVKLSVWQVAKAVSMGRLTIKFLLSLNVQEADGSFRTLAGGPYPMSWKINIRRLKLPEFAQIAADFNGDGWKDVMLEKGKQVHVTPVDTHGFHMDRKWRISLPKGLDNPDQVYGRDLDGNGRAELVAVKVKAGKTRLGIKEVKP